MQFHAQGEEWWVPFYRGAEKAPTHLYPLFQTKLHSHNPSLCQIVWPRISKRKVCACTKTHGRHIYIYIHITYDEHVENSISLRRRFGAKLQPCSCSSSFERMKMTPASWYFISNSGHASTVQKSNAGHAMDIPVASWSQRELPVPSPIFSSVATRTKLRKGMLDQNKAGRRRARQLLDAEVEWTVDIEQT